MNDANLMKIKVSRLKKVQPYVRHPDHLLCITGLEIEFSGYDLEEVIAALLEDYPEEKIIEHINQLCNKKYALNSL